MKLLHTSDLHYGHVWRGIPRLADQNRVLDEILGICEVRNVDLLLIAGDVFSNRLDHVTPASMARQLLDRLAPALRRGMGVFLLWGNHDNFPLFQLMRALTAELAGGPGRWPLVIADEPAVYDLPGLPHVAIGLPYLSPRQLLNSAIAADSSPEEQAANLNGLLSQSLPRLYGQYERTHGGRPAIFATHFLVEGFTLNEEEGTTFESYHRDLRIRPADLPHFTSYNALGHIHLRQQIRGAAKPTWYSGAPDRLDLGERGYTPGVLLVDLPDTPGGAATVEEVLLQGCTPFVKETLDGLDAVERFCDTVATSDLLGEVMVLNTDVSARGRVLARMQAAAPRVKLYWTDPARATPQVSGDWIDASNPLVVVRRHLAEQFEGDPSQRDRLIAAFEELVAADEASTVEASA